MRADHDGGVMQVKQMLKSVLHRALKREPLEHLVGEAYRHSPRLARPWLRKMAPHPRDYAHDELRQVTRRGLRWTFYPAAYFQWHHYFGFDDPVLDVLRVLARESRVVMDVGANVGLYSLVMATEAPRATVHAFEPHPETYQRLSSHQKLNSVPRVCCHPCAVGATPGNARLLGAADADLGKASLHDHGNNPTGGEALDVEVVTLDGVVRDQRLETVDLIKIDVEGFEPEVLQGAKTTLETHAPWLVIELSPQWYGDRAAQARETFSTLLRLGYRFLEIAAPEAPPPLLREMDLLAALDGRTQRNVLGLPPRRALPASLAGA